MAHLDSRTTNGSHAWDKYIVGNSNWQKLTLVLENATVGYIKQHGKLIRNGEYVIKTPLQLKHQKYEVIDGIKYAHAIINHKQVLIPVKNIRKPTNSNPTQYEVEVVNAINKKIEENNNIPIDIMIHNKLYKSITGAIQVNTAIKQQAGVDADPKADIILYKNKNMLLSTENIFISHKKEGGPAAFQQYSGISEKAGNMIYNHAETQKFLANVVNYIEEDQLVNPLFSVVKDATLINKSIFGPDFGKHFGLNNVQIIGQGMVRLTPASIQENTFTMTFSSEMIYNGNHHMFVGDYAPVFGATFRAGRGFVYKGKQYKGARIGIYPRKLIVNRGGIVEIK